MGPIALAVEREGGVELFLREPRELGRLEHPARTLRGGLLDDLRRPEGAVHVHVAAGLDVQHAAALATLGLGLGFGLGLGSGSGSGLGLG